MAGARALWRANGMKEEQIGRPVIAIVNSFTQFVPGHMHLHEIGQLVKSEIEKSRRKRCEIANRILDLFQKRIDDEMEWETCPDLSYDDVERGRNAFKVYREFLEDFIKYPEKYPRQLYEVPRKKDKKE